MPVLSRYVCDHADSLRISVNADLSTALKCLASYNHSPVNVSTRVVTSLLVPHIITVHYTYGMLIVPCTQTLPPPPPPPPPPTPPAVQLGMTAAHVTYIGSHIQTLLLQGYRACTCGRSLEYSTATVSTPLLTISRSFLACTSGC